MKEKVTLNSSSDLEDEAVSSELLYCYNNVSIIL